MSGQAIDSRRSAVGLVAFATVVALAAILLSQAEAAPRRTVESLGYPGETVRLAVSSGSPERADVGPVRLSADVATFIADRGLSLAWTASGASHRVTLLDPGRRFGGLDPDLRGYFDTPGGSGVAVVSTAVQGAGQDLVTPLPADTRMVGTFSSQVAFDAVYPATIVNVAAAPFDAGYYLLAGADPADRDDLIGLLEVDGMTVWDVSTRSPPTWRRLAVSPYGVVVLGSLTVLATIGLVVTSIAASSVRDRLLVTAGWGATRPELRRLVLIRLAPAVVAGVAAGVAVSAAVLLGLHRLLLASTLTLATQVALATGTATVLWGLIMLLVTDNELRWCRHVVPC